MGVLHPLKVVIENYPAGQVEQLTVANHPKIEALGTRELPFTREIYIDREDFREEANRKYKRLVTDGDLSAWAAFGSGFSADELLWKGREFAATIAPLLVGVDAFDREYLWQRLWYAQRFFYTGRQVVDMVDRMLWDLASRWAKLPVYKLKGPQVDKGKGRDLFLKAMGGAPTTKENEHAVAHRSGKKVVEVDKRSGHIFMGDMEKMWNPKARAMVWADGTPYTASPPAAPAWNVPKNPGAAGTATAKATVAFTTRATLYPTSMPKARKATQNARLCQAQTPRQCHHNLPR